LKLLAKSLSPLPVIKQQVQEDGSVVEFGEFSAVETAIANVTLTSRSTTVFVKCS